MSVRSTRTALLADSSHLRRKQLAAVAALAVAASLAVGTVSSHTPAGAATVAEVGAAQTVLQTMNAERHLTGRSALGWSTALVSSAHRHNLNMAAANLLSHQLPNEPVFTTRISQAGVAWHSAAENIGWTTDISSRGANSLEVAMFNEAPPSDGHRLNILSTSVRYVGIDTYFDARTGKLWLTEDFADVAGPAAVSPHQPVGNLDTATREPGHKARLAGWAVDPDSKATPLYIAVFWDGHFAGYFRKPMARPDVARAKGAGPMQGYCIFIVMPAGRHTVSTFGVNVGAGSAMTKLASKVVTV